jgi:glycosyltransferase involved in cell wall biosynthesis
MKIACISASQIPSNTANSIQVMKACQALAQLGHTLVLSVPLFKPEQNIAPDLKSTYGLQTIFPIEWLPVNLRLRRYDLAWRAVKDAHSWRADLVYTWLPQAALYSQLRGLPVILELHGPPEGRFGPWLFRLLFRLPGRLRVLAITHVLADMMKKYLPAKAKQPARMDQWIISPNGIDLERYADLPEPAEARRTLGLTEMPTAAYTGHLYPGRGADLLFTLAQQLPEMQFLWIGGRESDVQRWKNRLEAQNIQNVHLTGFIKNSDLPIYQAAAEVLLMPYERVITGSSGGNSGQYASPMKMFEYMACRRAIISSDLPILHEVLNESNAVFCPPEDPDAWREALSALLGDKNRRETIALQAWQDVQQYTWLERARRALAGFP